METARAFAAALLAGFAFVLPRPRYLKVIFWMIALYCLSTSVNTLTPSMVAFLLAAALLLVYHPQILGLSPWREPRQTPPPQA